MTSRYVRRMRRDARRLTIDWGRHRAVLRPYRRRTGQFQADREYHAGQTHAAERADLLLHGIRLTEGLIVGCSMSFEAMPRMLVREPLSGPFFAISRVCLEAAARVDYVFNQSLSPDQRLMRFAALWAWNNGESRKGVSAMTGRPDGMPAALLAEVATEASHLDTLVRAAGFEVDRSGRHPVIRDPAGVLRPESAELNLVDILERMLPSVGSARYRRWSGSVHSAPWVHRGALRQIAADLMKPVLSPTDIAETFLIVAATFGRMVSAFSFYSGIPVGRIEAAVSRILVASETEIARQHEPMSRFASMKIIQRAKRRWRGMVNDAWGLTAPEGDRDREQ